MIAAGRPFLPLFLHILGAMVLVGAMLTVLLLTVTAWRRPLALLSKSTFRTLLIVAIPAWLLMRACGQWMYSEEGWSGDNDPTWLGIGYLVGDFGLLILLITTGVAFWWNRSNKAVAGRIVAVLSLVYLVLLGVAWLAMSGKWGS
jgi:hypothetical protein